MANEITYAVSMSVLKDSAAISTGTLSDTIAMAGADVITATQDFTYNGTTATALDLGGSVAGDVHVVIKNLDDAQTVIIIHQATVSGGIVLSSLAPGEACSLRRVPSNKLFCDVLVSGSARIQYWISEV
jgi:hypothetical protein